MSRTAPATPACKAAGAGAETANARPAGRLEMPAEPVRRCGAALPRRVGIPQDALIAALRWGE